MEAANTAPTLFDPLSVGDLELPNRLVMAPLTRLRSGDAGVPGDLVVEYYRQRAGLGLIVTEGTWPSQEGKGYPGQPGIVTDDQVAAWGRVAEAVHGAGGRLYMQVMHAGRVSHTDVTGTPRIVGPSAIAIDGEVRTPTGKAAYPVPHALTTAEAKDVITEFVTASKRAVEAGLDGVEIHGANGYLLHEFLSPAANQREDQYGGSPQARASFVVDVVKAVVAEIGADKVGLRISPAHNIQDAFERDTEETATTYGALVDAIAPLQLAYLSVLHAEPSSQLVQDLKRRFAGPFLLNSGFGSVTGRDDAQTLVAEGLADGVVVGRAAIANPDLAHRWENGLPENEPDPNTFYSPGAQGYTDYPALQAG